MAKHRLAIYVTLLDDSEMVEYYVVAETGDGASDLVREGFCLASKLNSALSASLSELLEEPTAAPST